MVTGNAVHAREELLLFAGLSALGTAKPVAIFLTACVLVFLWVWVLSVPPYVKRVRSLRYTKASGLALPGLVLLTDRGFTRWKTVTGNAVHAREELLLFAGLSALGTAKPVTVFR